MKKLLLLLLLATPSVTMFAQEDVDTSWKKTYRESAPKINDLVHTKLDASFDYSKSQLLGKVWITLKPHFYSTDSLSLDAKGMDIKKVALTSGSKQSDLKYAYDGYLLNIKLPRAYKNSEEYTIYIDYVAKPNEFKTKGSAAITDAKGLYFINPTGEIKDKPTQIWTQGETEGTSVWVPTIDRPNQKTTNEFNLRVPAKYVTLSNGKLIAQKTNSDGTRTDSWKMDQPHSPYLFFIGVGDFSVVKDSYKGKEVSYYVEKEYASVARKIFGDTPEMIGFFSKVLGVEYPWVKYSQMVGRDYVSGAMENTTATLHQESAQQDARELVDGNSWESVIAHELFHQWFGDYVTTESWSNLTLNESFANYSEYLWDEYKRGKDYADAHNYSDMQGYLFSQSDQKDLVRFYYGDKEDMFDAVSYNKGGRILNMLRNTVGDSAFFKALNLYLNTNKYKSAEAHQLRLAFEEVTGRDLNWFWNQWYFGAGHPKLTIDYVYDDAAGKVNVIVKQTQKGQIFRLPVKVDVYNGGNKQTYNVISENAVDTFTFKYTSKPDLVNFDADKALLAEKRENKTLENYIHQYKYAGNYYDRKEAVDFAVKKQDDSKALDLLKVALSDRFPGIRSLVVGKLDLKKENVRKQTLETITALAKTDPKRSVKSAALLALGNLKDPALTSLFKQNISDSSYSVSGSALEALSKIDSSLALAEAKKLSTQPAKGKLVEAITKLLMASGDVSGFPMIAKAFEDMPPNQAKFNMIAPFSEMIGKVESTDQVKRGVNEIVKFRNAIPEQYGLTPVMNNFLNQIIEAKEKQSETSSNKSALTEQIDYIKSVITDSKKGF
jgi:aminopeptidase N